MRAVIAPEPGGPDALVVAEREDPEPGPGEIVLDVVATAGATAVIQPGGSLRDAEVVAAADERGMAMVLTGIRHFRH